MALPAWIREEFDWLHREMLRLNRDLQAFGRRVGDLENVLQGELTEQPSLPRPAIPGVGEQRTKAESPSTSGEVVSEIAGDPRKSAPATAEPAQAVSGSHLALSDIEPSQQLSENRPSEKGRAHFAPQPAQIEPVPDSSPIASQIHPRPSRAQRGNLLAREIPPTVRATALLPKVASSQPAIDWEKVIGEKWMTWVGGFTLLLAIGFAVQWAWVTFEVPDWLQVAISHLFGLGLLMGGYLFHRRQLPLVGQAVLGLGIFTLYAAAYAALRLYALWDERTAFIEGAAITALAIVVAVRANSPGVILLGALGGYLTPILTSTNSGNYVGLFTYLAFLNVALVACAVWKAWSFVKPLTMLATVVMFGLWIASSKFDATNSQIVWGTEWFAALHSLIFLVGSTVPPVLWKRTSVPADLVALTSCSFFFVGFTWLLFHDRPQQQLALVSWGVSALHAVLFGATYARVTNADRMPRFHLALAAVFFTLAIPLQLDDAAYWGVTWCVEVFVFTAVGVWFRDRQMCVSALLVFVLAAGRLIVFDFQSAPRLLGQTGLDLRFLLFMISGLLGLQASAMYRLIPWTQQRAAETDEWLRSIPECLTAIAVVLITLAPPLQIDDRIYLGPAWAFEALAFTAVGLLARDRVLCIAGLVVFALAGARLLIDASGDLISNALAVGPRYQGAIANTARPLTNAGWDRSFLATEFSSLMALTAGSFYWLIPTFIWRDAKLYQRQRSAIGGSVLAIANLAIMAGLTLQWQGRLVLVLWTLDAAIIWAAGFWYDRTSVRSYATFLGLLLVGGRAVSEGYSLAGPFQLIFNERFGSLLLVALLYFVFGGLYRWKYRGVGFEALMDVMGWADGRKRRAELSRSSEAALDPVLGILGNLTLLTAISFEIHSWYAAARQTGWQPFGNMQMAELATYSIVWAIYAAIMVAVGFAVRYPLFRILGLAAFAPILLKVFFYDLAELKWLPRVLALAVLGLMLLGVSLLYQKFAARLLKQDAPTADPPPESSAAG